MNILFECTVEAENGVEVSHHSIVRAQLSADLSSLMIVVESWPAEEQRLAGVGPAWAWEVTPLVSALELDDGLHAGLLAAVLADARFPGGVEVDDAADTLEGAQARQLAELLAYRQSLEFGPLEYDTDTFDGDAIAQTRVVGATLAAAVARIGWLVESVQALATAASVTLPVEPTFLLHWTLADDTERDMDEEDMYGLLDAFATRGEDTHVDWRTVREEVLDATTIEEARAVTWPA